MVELLVNVTCNFTLSFMKITYRISHSDVKRAFPVGGVYNHINNWVFVQAFSQSSFKRPKYGVLLHFDCFLLLL